MSDRVSPAGEPFSDDIQAWIDKTMPPGVPPLRLFTTLARDERLFKKFFAGGLLDKGHLSLRQRELVIDRTTALCGAEYEWGVHVAFFASRIGLTDNQRFSIVHGSAEDPCWSEEDRLLLRMCDELQGHCTLSDGLWNSLRARYSEEAMLELLMVAGFYRTVSYLANSLQLPLEPYAARFPNPPAH